MDPLNPISGPGVGLGSAEWGREGLWVALTSVPFAGKLTQCPGAGLRGGSENQLTQLPPRLFLEVLGSRVSLNPRGQETEDS